MLWRVQRGDLVTCRAIASDVVRRLDRDVAHVAGRAWAREVETVSAHAVQTPLARGERTALVRGARAGTSHAGRVEDGCPRRWCHRPSLRTGASLRRAGEF